MFAELVRLSHLHEIMKKMNWSQIATGCLFIFYLCSSLCCHGTSKSHNLHPFSTARRARPGLRSHPSCFDPYHMRLDSRGHCRYPF